MINLVYLNRLHLILLLYLNYYLLSYMQYYFTIQFKLNLWSSFIIMIGYHLLNYLMKRC